MALSTLKMFFLEVKLNGVDRMSWAKGYASALKDYHNISEKELGEACEFIDEQCSKKE